MNFTSYNHMLGQNWSISGIIAAFVLKASMRNQLLGVCFGPPYIGLLRTAFFLSLYHLQATNSTVVEFVALVVLLA